MKTLKVKAKSQKGLTLIELIVVLVVIGIIFPTIFSLAGVFSVKATEYMLMQEANYLAEMKMEEILGFKTLNWDWYKRINKYVKTESLSRGFKRTVSVNKLKNWGKAGIDYWEVTVTVTHPKLKKGVNLAVRLTQYYENTP